MPSFKIELMNTPPRPRKTAGAGSSSHSGPRKGSSGLELGDATSLMESLHDTAGTGVQAEPESWPLSFPSSGGQGAAADVSTRSDMPPESFDPSRADGGVQDARSSFPDRVGDVSAPHAAAVLLVCGALGLVCAGAISVLCVLLPGPKTTCGTGGPENSSGLFSPYNCASFGHFNPESRNEVCNTLAPCPETNASNRKCCLQNASCEHFNCSLWPDSVLIGSAGKKSCLNVDGCTDEDNVTCCQSRCTCSSPSCWGSSSPLQCPSGSIRNISAGEEQCVDATKCTLPNDNATCCEPATNCAEFACQTPWVTRIDAANISCTEQDCTEAECCLALLTCTEWNKTSTCDPDTSLLQDVSCVNGSKGRALYPECSAATCCNTTATYCSACPPGRRARAGAGEVRCLSSPCSEDDVLACCEPAADEGIEL